MIEVNAQPRGCTVAPFRNSWVRLPQNQTRGTARGFESALEPRTGSCSFLKLDGVSPVDNTPSTD